MSQAKMNELHEELHEACRQMLRYSADAERHDEAYTRMSKTTHAITDYQNSAELADEEEEQEFNDKRYTESPYSDCVNSESRWAVNGPGDGLGHNAGYLNPHLNCVDQREAKRAATIANIAHGSGYALAQYDIQKALGLAKKR